MEPRESRIAEALRTLFWEEMADEPCDVEWSRERIHRLIFGMVANRMTRFEDALALPERLLERAGGSRDILNCLLGLGERGAAELIGRPRALHRYPNRISSALHGSACHIDRTWQGDARRMWLDGDPPTGRALVARLEKLPGVGPKISNLTARALMLSAGVKCADGLSSISASPDRHCLRVFHRLGLTPSEHDPRAMMLAAAHLSPEAPVAMDSGWLVGMWWCHAGTPACESGCVLRNECPRAPHGAAIEASGNGSPTTTDTREGSDVGGTVRALRR
jgi:endonuclease III